MQPGKLKKAAFFDVDNTLINLKSMFSFMEYFFDHSEANLGFADHGEFVDFINRHPQKNDRKALNRIFYRCFSGWKKDEVSQAAQDWFNELNSTLGEDLWIKPAIEKVKQLRDEDYLIVAVSGSSNEILAPVVQHLALDHCLATHLKVVLGRFTGEIEASMIGRGKAFAIEQFCHENNINREASLACGDHYSDLFMLESVGRGIVVAGDPPLEAVAKKRSWEILNADYLAQEGALAHV